MGRRHQGHKFMPGQIRLSRRAGRTGGPADGRRRGARTRCRGETQSRASRGRRPAFARAIALAAIRETFEETGLAIGVADYGAPEDPPPGAWASFAATGVYPALDGIDFLARAITPPDGRSGSTRAFSSSTRARSPGASRASSIRRRNSWISSGRRSTRRASSTCRNITHLALDDLAQALKAASTGTGRGPSIGSCAASGCARRCEPL